MLEGWREREGWRGKEGGKGKEEGGKEGWREGGREVLELDKMIGTSSFLHVIPCCHV